jgi:hypothetical protein
MGTDICVFVTLLVVTMMASAATGFAASFAASFLPQVASPRDRADTRKRDRIREPAMSGKDQLTVKIVYMDTIYTDTNS